MKVKVNKNREVFKGGLSVGISNENNYEVLEFTFPAELDNYIKYIEIQAENEEGKLEYVDRIQDNKFTLTNRLTKYRELNMEISCRDLNRTVFKSEIFTVTTGEALNILEDLVQEQEDLFERVERELQEVYQGMEDFKTEIVEDANSRFNTNVTEKTQGFNTNAETKTTDFNNNYDTKLNSFNSNYDEKLGTFNTNATNKLTEYNNNDTAKTGAYNTNATEKLSAYNTNATNKVAEYNTNAETKLNAYNTNATQKLAEYDSRVADLHEDLDETQAKVEQYNTNIDTKYTQYNTNATEKLNTYNSNATTKTSEYNTNAQTKLEAYNTNAQSKKEDFDTNAEEKLQEYNDNASALMQSVETLEQKHNTEVAELNEKIADLQEEVDMASDLIPTGDESGSDITVEDSARYYFKKLEVGGKSEQETFTGKNLLLVKSSDITPSSWLEYDENLQTFTIKQGSGLAPSAIPIDINLKVGDTITVSVIFESGKFSIGTISIGPYHTGDTTSWQGTINVPRGENLAERTFTKTHTITAEINAFEIFLYNAPTIDTDIVFKVMIEKGSTATDYEKYVGGQPAPSPIYECSIQNVTGNVEVKVENKNLFDTNNWYDTLHSIDSSSMSKETINNVEYIKFNANNSNVRNFKFMEGQFKENTQYTLSAKALRYNNGATSTGFKFMYTDGTQKVDYINQTTEYNFVISSDINKTIASICLSFANSSNALIRQIQLEEGSTATDYVPHEEQTVTFPLAEGQILHEGDTIEDKIVQRRKTYKITGEENWLTYEGHGEYSNNLHCYYGLSNVLTDSKQQIKTSICTHFENPGTWVIVPANAKNGTYQDNPNNKNRYFITDISTIQEFKAWLAEQYTNGTPVTIEYELETPIETEFTETQRTAKAQIDKLYSYKGTTYITSEANLNVIYRKDPNLAEEQQNNKLEELEARIALLEG